MIGTTHPDWNILTLILNISEKNPSCVPLEKNNGSEFGTRTNTHVYEIEGLDVSKHGISGTDDSAAYTIVTEPGLLKFAPPLPPQRTKC